MEQRAKTVEYTELNVQNEMQENVKPQKDGNDASEQLFNCEEGGHITKRAEGEDADNKGNTMIAQPIH